MTGQSAHSSGICRACLQAGVEPWNGSYRQQRIMRCARCGHAQAVFEDIGEAELHRTQLDHFGEAFVRHVSPYQRFYDRLNAHRIYKWIAPREPQRVLDVGPGRGALSRHFAERGHQVTALDVSPQVVEAACGLGVRAWVGDLEAHAGRAGLGNYTLVLLCHVLEHMREPVRELQNVEHLLAPRGRCCVVVPNFGSWHRAFRGWSGYQPYHLHYFTQQSLTSALTLAEFRPVRCGSHEGLTGWANTLVRSVKTGDVTQEARAPQGLSWRRHVLELGRLGFGLMIGPVRSCQAALGRGEELLVIARKER